ncbi:MAG TPA: hypothetical protein VIE36_13580 [Methylomirabilota bacterium]|jgi:hypothetical protein
MPVLAAILLLLLFMTSGEASDRGGACLSAQARRDSQMPSDLAAEVKRLQRNQAVLMTAVNRLIAETAPIALANPADGSSGYVTKGLVLDAEGFIVPGTIPAPDPGTTLRGTRAGDPLWFEAPPSP